MHRTGLSSRLQTATLEQSPQQPLTASAGNPNRIWFVCKGDSDYDLDENGYLIDEDGSPVLDEDGNPVEYAWDVEPWDGQFVNRLGFFVTTEPCRPEHCDEIFTC